MLKTISASELKNLETFGNERFFLITRYRMPFISRLEKQKHIHIQWIPKLAPDSQLFHDFRENFLFFKNNGYDERASAARAWFITKYDLRFRRMITRDSEKMGLIRFIKDVSREQPVYLICYCKHEEFCHRSIIKSIIEGATWK